MEYSYPLNPDWTTEEMTIVVQFLEAIERAYEKGIDTLELKEKYRAFKQVVPAKGEEKRIGIDFVKASGYSAYKVMQLVKNATTSKIKMQP
ncbi:hypothetical protein H6V28_001845 [Listeria monocytogenes]|uniref:UPF0223 family protein n=1 Tax=Listeria monocytogenes TaxID=1639 RepID=UPI000BF72FB3|nr:UPF0223 family protein [Listeria monocytogenes]EAC2857817.1 hypothetical protein [Listeria monocytogenes]EAC3374572.1 hypothetical protein [Listeria monocytogenes]EAC3727219.1 hypothetical protein [Listeria monocytogenes]EAC4056643.1 hypothetical protein [Listeria monocytogenes]EAC4509993.1 hypothetical protein [Listeria monocytogenes]